MKRFLNPGLLVVAFGALLTLIGLNCASPTGPGGNSPETNDSAAAEAIILESPEGLSQFTVTGTTAEFGRYLALGEATFVLGEQEGELDGTGIAVVQAGNEDQIVADVTSKVTNEGLDFTFHWRDSVTFNNGSTAANTGVFVDYQPPGLFLSRIRGRKFNDTTTVCKYCCCTTCGDTSCSFQCGFICCGPASGGPVDENCQFSGIPR